MRTIWIAATAMIATLGAGSVAAAEPDAQAFAKRLLGHEVAAKGNTYACFARRYDAAHLRRHSQQKTTAMKLLVSAEMVPDHQQPNYSFTLGMTFRDRKGHFDTTGSCGHPAAEQEGSDKLVLGCGVDCDGGGLQIEMANDDKSVIVRIDRMAIWNNDRPDDERGSFDGGADDKAFRLDRVGLEECKPLMPKDDTVAALEQR
ncbi:MAG TPA: hypothetical protein VFW22_01610 [Pseudolabrys sp.]|nr:hypothetical protein [Pseudolabrys sp.]